MKKVNIVLSIFILITSMLLIEGCRKETSAEENTDIIISGVEFVTGHGESMERAIGYIGSSNAVINIERLDVKNGMDRMVAKIYSNELNYTFEKDLTKESNKGQKIIVKIHRHLTLPNDIPAGEYIFAFTVYDQTGGYKSTESKIQIKPNNSDPLSSVNEEPTGLKLLMTYQGNNKLDIMDLGSNNKIDEITLDAPNSKIVQDIEKRTGVTKIVVYSDNYIEFILTGLDPHGDHYHVTPPIKSKSHNVNIVTKSPIKWNGYFFIYQDNQTGNYVGYSIEDIENKAGASVTLTNNSTPFTGICVDLAVGQYGMYFATVGVDANKQSSINVLAQTRTTEIKKSFLFSSLGIQKVTDVAIYRENRKQYGLFATDKNLFTVSIQQPQEVITDKNIAYPVDFNGGIIDALLVKEVTAGIQNIVYAIKKDKGVYIVDVMGTQFRPIITSTIKTIAISPLLSYMYILDANNNLKIYDIKNNYTELKSINITLTGNIRLIASENFLYLGIEGGTEILRFKSKTLEKVPSITTKDKISDIGLAGNLNNEIINNH